MNELQLSSADLTGGIIFANFLYNNRMKILAVETSCDDTCVSIVEATPIKGSKVPSFRILSNITSSQIKIHKHYGGVVPTLAKRAHENNLVTVLKKSLGEAGVLKNKKSRIKNQNDKSKFKILESIFDKEPVLMEKFLPYITKIEKPGIDIIAVTYGPGLEPALWAGVNFARALSFWWSIPLLGVDHMEGHISANFLPKIGKMTNDQLPIINFPALCLAVSGGHTQLLIVKNINKYELIGETVDDAAGEGFDKVARLLGLSFPGGPQIARLAATGDARAFNFARPMINSKNYNFSFSGLKTSVLYGIKKLVGKKLDQTLEKNDFAKLSKQTKADIAASFQQAAVDVLISKTIRAARDYRVKTVMLAGGVAANKKLRDQLGSKIKSELYAVNYQLLTAELATDNAAMIAAAAYFRKNRARIDKWKTLTADGNLKIS
ncbi:MAG: hypothetical protein A3B96_02675 [Candidatus Spechtbacteria bacterium RIFCSPHIGHO2_02_FULL_43_15b]|nr:MAG: hypothetical protein A3B96_02675 [Candidatus Spechtbacteria bacterium RIFCSPHIGHO2_02_FULL_43_15b]